MVYAALPLTLTLSPQAGRGDVPDEQILFEEAGATYPFAPLAGRRCRQADEGMEPMTNHAAMR
jgi:hypothetical protein